MRCNNHERSYNRFSTQYWSSKTSAAYSWFKWMPAANDSNQRFTKSFGWVYVAMSRTRREWKEPSRSSKTLNSIWVIFYQNAYEFAGCFSCFISLVYWYLPNQFYGKKQNKLGASKFFMEACSRFRGAQIEILMSNSCSDTVKTLGEQILAKRRKKLATPKLGFCRPCLRRRSN